MKTYLVCDNDGTVYQDGDAWLAHFNANPSHTSHIGVGGDSSSPTPYSTGGGISVVTSDPPSPSVNDMWVLRQGMPGNAMGLMGLTYADSHYFLSIKGAAGTYRVQLT